MKNVLKRLCAAIACVTLAATLVPSVAFAEVQKEVSATSSAGVVEKVDRRFIAYFPEWAYKNEQNENYTADKMPWDKITHINYAFAHVDAKTNKIALGDKAAAIELEFPGQTADFPYKGHFNVLNSYKKKYPKVKTMISVGGWAESGGFYSMLSTVSGRETFANSVVDFLKTYGFDGVDIDFEYPTNLEDAGNPIDFDMAKPYRAKVYGNYVEMMKLLREKLDAASAEDSKTYLLTAAVTASAWVTSGMGEENYCKYLDFLNLMTYDFHGSWNGFVAHNSPLYSDPNDPEIKYWGLPYNYLSTDWAVKYYSGMIDPSKIVVGIPYYTRGWEKVTPSSYPGGLYGSAWGTNKIPDGPGTGAVGIDNIWHDDLADGSEEPGGSNPLWHAKNLLADKSLGYVRYWDNNAKVPYIWNESKKVWLSYEDEQSMNEKVDYIIKNGLGGAMVWEIDGDFDQDSTGKYVVGDTLTTIANDKFKAAGPIEVIDNSNSLQAEDFDIELINNYDHPNNSYKINFINNTGKAIEKPCTIEFDLPNCFGFRTDPWASGGTVKMEDRGLNKHFTITFDQWGITIGTKKTTIMEGDMILRALGGPKNLRLNGKASKAELDRLGSQTPSLLPATLSSNIVESRDGNFNLTVKVPANSKATSFDLYEGNTIIKSQAVTNAGGSFDYNITGKANGTYSYKVVMKSETKQIDSNIVSVFVGPEVVLKPAVVTSSVDISDTGNYTVKVSVPANSNGTKIDLYEGTTIIGTQNIDNTAKDLSFDIKGKSNGTYQYKAIISGGTKKIESNIKEVNVSLKVTYETYNPSKAYTFNDIVQYQGKVYQSLAWWNVGIIPGTHSGVWKLIGNV